jgi:predicted MFS family arabinose efflux permease
MINTTFNIGITVGAALGGLILTSTSPVNLIITSIAGVVAVTAISVIPRWLPPDRAQSP